MKMCPLLAPTRARVPVTGAPRVVVTVTGVDVYTMDRAPVDGCISPLR